MAPDASPDDTTSFSDLGLRPELLDVLTRLGYEEPTPIQREAIPVLLEGSDLVGQAATGTGKTAAFALPILDRLGAERDPGGDGGGRRSRDPMALVLVPTRELAVQVSEAMHRYGSALGARVVPIYGGQPIHRQLQAFERGVDVVVATPGRALDHIGRSTLRLDSLRTVVLDEADEMLDMGFAEDIESILEGTPKERQTVLFSATMPPRVGKIAQRHLRSPKRIEIGREQTPAGEAPKVREVAYIVTRQHKPAALGRILDVESPTAAIVFCRTRDEVDQLTTTLNGRGYRAEALHGGMDQVQRDRVMGRLRNGTTELLIATDVAARGLDVDVLTHVVNYDVPSAPEAYVHRVGRVGRAGREGVAITLAEPREHRMLKVIERVSGRRIDAEKVPSVADLRARRLALTRAAIEESLIGDGDLDTFRPVVEALAEEYDVIEVALAAVKLAHEATGGATDEEDIPELAPSRPRDRDDRGRGERGDRGGPPWERGPRPGPAGRGPRTASAGMARLFVGVGRTAGIRPQDLVGAITGETDLRGKEIGAIEITDRFSIVEVPEAAADTVISALGASTIKGRRATVRRDQRHDRGGYDRGGYDRGDDRGGFDRRPPRR